MSAERREADRREAPFRPVRLVDDAHDVERRPDGSILVRNRVPLGPYAARVTDWLVRWAAEAPDRTFVAKREAGGEWARLTYADALARARRLGGALLSRGLSAERPLVILSGNDREHAALALAAMHVGVPYAPVSPAYSQAAGDFARLRDILGLLTPGLVFVAEAGPYARAIAAAVPPDVEVVLGAGALPDRRRTPLASFEREGSDAKEVVARANAAVGPDSVAKLLFTSGSTGLPKGVLTTHRMLCANQAQIAANLAFLTDSPPVLVDWLPWHHVFGGSHNFNIVLANGGSIYVDDGRPVPALIGETVRNLREVSPSAYFTVPKGYEALIPHLRDDAELRRSFYAKLELTFFAAAGLPQPIWDAFDAVSVAETGFRIPMITGLGSTETAPLALTCPVHLCRSGRVGLPARGCELKLAPVADKLEARLRGPNITPGYWRNDEMTRGARDEEGFYRLGDALDFVDPDDPAMGLFFNGRLNEDFKLTSGVWVSVGALRAAFLDRAAPYARDVAVAGENRGDIAVLVVPDVDACRALCPDLPKAASADDVLAQAEVRRAFAAILAAGLRDGRGSSHTIERAILMAEPPSMDLNEVTDKGSINQRATLANRAALVEELYAEPYSARIIMPAA
jgi:feruloyl-CoA synthase